MSEHTQTSDTQTSGTQRLGTYWHSETFDLARRAYLADLDTLPEGPDSLGAWIDAAIRTHADLSPQRRAEVADSLPPETKDPRGKSRSFIVAVRTVEALETALIADRRHGRVLSRGAFVSRRRPRSGPTRAGPLRRPPAASTSTATEPSTTRQRRTTQLRARVRDQ